MCRDGSCLGVYGSFGGMSGQRATSLPFDLSELGFKAMYKFGWEIADNDKIPNKQFYEQNSELEPFDNGEGMMALGSNKDVTMSEFVAYGEAKLKEQGASLATKDDSMKKAAQDLAAVLKGKDPKVALYYVTHVLEFDVSNYFIKHGGMAAFSDVLPSFVALNEDSIGFELEEHQGMVLSSGIIETGACMVFELEEIHSYAYFPSEGVLFAYADNVLDALNSGGKLNEIGEVNESCVEAKLFKMLPDLVNYLDHNNYNKQAWQLFFLHGLMSIKTGKD